MLKITQKIQAIVRVTVQKTRKKYTRSKYYAKTVTTERRGEKTVEYFLREGRGWREVNKKEFDEATSEEAVSKIEEQLGRELRQRVEEEMKNA